MKIPWFEAAIGAVVGYWLGLNAIVQVLIILQALDVISGVIVAASRRELNSDASFKGILKKMMTLVVVLMAAVAQPALPEPVNTLPLVPVIAGFFAAHEGLSILENAAMLGVPMPPLLTDALKKLSGSGKLNA